MVRPLALLHLTAAPAEACRLALALGFDVQASVDAADYAIQRDGIVAALAAPEIRRAVPEADEPVALAVSEGGGRQAQQTVAGSVLIEDVGDRDRVSAAVLSSDGMRPWQPTAIGAALVHALELFGTAPDCAARTLDLSGDGRNNDWPTLRRICAREDFGDIVVSGLAIGGHEADIAACDAAEVIRGPGAFVEQARTDADFPPAIRRKPECELTGPVLGAAPRPAVRTRG